MANRNGPIPAPEWVEGMVLYEVATRSFTSPIGPESGTFASLRARLPYIRDLGATCIWLTGQSLSDPSHFYNIWTQYACIEPDKLDPVLGNDADFKALVDDAHALGLRVILDVITHGIMPQSPIVRAKPHWFKGGSWGMTDFDWSGHHPDLDDWWVDVWAGYVEKFGIDGFRLDVAAYRWDLWQRVRARAAAVGHPIVIVTEHGPSFQGVNDFYQRSSVRLSNQIRGLLADAPMLHDVPAAVRELVAPFNEQYSVQVMLPTGHPISTQARDGAEPALRIVNQTHEPFTARDAAGHALWEQTQVVLEVEGMPAAQDIRNLIVFDGRDQEWQANDWVEADSRVGIERNGTRLRLTFTAKYPPGQLISIQLSSHDDGWHGSPLDKNPYVAQGSRFVFGYGFLLTPLVPLFMSGEEFNCDFRPLPTLSPHLFGGGAIGAGRWLYGSWIDWEQLEQPERAAMLADVQRLITIRRSRPTLFKGLRVGDDVAHLQPLAVTLEGEGALPTPYLYRNGDECLLVAGNPSSDRDVKVRLDGLAEASGWAPDTLVTVEDLWSGHTPVTTTIAETAAHTMTIPRDKQSRGGLLVWSIRKA